MNRKLSYEQKEAMQMQKDSICEEQGGVCFYCPVDFNRDCVYPHAAHRIIPSVVNVKKYGYEILDNRLNFHITCSDCNMKAVVNPEGSAGRELIESIKHDIEIQKVMDRR